MDSSVDQMKENAALRAVEMVHDGMVLGLGSGSTVHHFLRLLAERIRNEDLDIVGVATSSQTEEESKKLGIPLSSLEEHPSIELDVDGADEVDQGLNLIKGGGGAHVREKIVAKASESLVIIVDESKLSAKLGEKRAVPVEVIPLALATVRRQVTSMGATCSLRSSENGPFVSDNGNYIIDCKFPPIDNPEQVERSLKLITGVVDSGIFSNMVDLVVIGTRDGSKILRAR